MDIYKNLSGQSETFLYETGKDYITLIFKGDYFDTGQKYHYSTKSMTLNNILEMQRLAKKGIGLRTFINKNWRSKIVNHEYKEDVNITWDNFIYKP